MNNYREMKNTWRLSSWHYVALRVSLVLQMRTFAVGCDSQAMWLHWRINRRVLETPTRTRTRITSTCRTKTYAPISAVRPTATYLFNYNKKKKLIIVLNYYYYYYFSSIQLVFFSLTNINITIWRMYIVSYLYTWKGRKSGAKRSLDTFKNGDWISQSIFI